MLFAPTQSRLRHRAAAVLVVASMFCCGVASGAELIVTITGVHPGPGSIRVALYADAGSFRHEHRAVKVLSAPADASAVAVDFRGIAAGRYAVLAYHDANDDKKLDLFLGMFPREGWGLSRDPEIIGPPRFSDSAFDVAADRTTIEVPLHY